MWKTGNKLRAVRLDIVSFRLDFCCNGVAFVGMFRGKHTHSPKCSECHSAFAGRVSSPMYNPSHTVGVIYVPTPFLLQSAGRSFALLRPGRQTRIRIPREEQIRADGWDPAMCNA